jgi:hypothetical protein
MAIISHIIRYGGKMIRLKDFAEILIDKEFIKLLCRFLRNPLNCSLAVILVFFLIFTYGSFEFIGEDFGQKYFYFFVFEFFILCTSFSFIAYSKFSEFKIKNNLIGDGIIEYNKQRKNKQNKLFLKLGILGVLTSLMFVGSTYFCYQKWLTSPSKEDIILVANFDKNEGLSSVLYSQLKKTTKSYKSVKIKSLNKVFTEKRDGGREARIFGKKRKAAMVLWGEEAPAIGKNGQYSINFTILSSFKKYIGSRELRQDDIEISELRDLKF